MHFSLSSFAVGGISGGLFNPTVTLGGATADLFAWSTIWVYLVVQLGAGIAAGLAFLVLNPGDRVLRTYTGGPNGPGPLDPTRCQHRAPRTRERSRADQGPRSITKETHA